MDYVAVGFGPTDDVWYMKAWNWLKSIYTELTEEIIL